MHGPRGQPAGAFTIPQSELLLHGDHAGLTICGFIRVRRWRMIDIIPSGKRQDK
ncbi:hypothetical protein IQ17_02407 [Bradyrhizobium daqingense]|uniref:Uncharacterized protein n=1 Tax=Bradyrhizobium daqingense TaxID=993502 RepID=A0A562LHA8_9BRAD|nr:hypothetical protein IQ17_02407 [Bradyrhizobium daqingense]